jgi:hypothetical protein
VGLESKGEGSWFQARDLSGCGFATMSKTSVFQVSGFFPLAQGDYAQVLLIICVVVQNKKRVLYVQVKNKPCMIYTVMRLIPWKQTRGSKTVESRSLLTQSSWGLILC